MTVEQLQTLPEYEALTSHQKAALLAFLSNGKSWYRAVKVAYPSSRHPSQLAAKLRHNPKIMGLAALMSQDPLLPSNQELGALLWSRLKNGEPMSERAYLQAVKLLMQLTASGNKESTLTRKDMLKVFAQ